MWRRVSSHRSDREPDVGGMEKHAVMPKRGSMPCYRHSHYACGFAAVEVNKGIFNELGVNKSTPVAENGLHSGRQFLAAGRQNAPTAAVYSDLMTVDLCEWTFSQSAFDLGRAEVYQFDSVEVKQRGVVVDLGVLGRSEAICDFQFVDKSSGDHVQSEYLREIPMRNDNGDLGLDIDQVVRFESGGNVFFVDAFLAQSPEFVLCCVSACHDLSIDFAKLKVRNKTERNGAFDRHFLDSEANLDLAKKLD